MKKTLKFLSWMFILLFTVSLSSCKDDDEDAPAVGIVGTWNETGDTGVSMIFNNDGTGTKLNKAGAQYFQYTYLEAEHSMKLWYKESSYVYNYTVQITGNTMMLTQGSSTSVYERAK